ncbi:hypothetical protein MBT84_00825 [Streptomyces sp. MBT84]|nr:hypothetical protein [Streptomyces sp. MBT84]
MTASDGNCGRSGQHRQPACIWDRLTARQDSVAGGSRAVAPAAPSARVAPGQAGPPANGTHPAYPVSAAHPERSAYPVSSADPGHPTPVSESAYPASASHGAHPRHVAESTVPVSAASWTSSPCPAHPADAVNARDGLAPAGAASSAVGAPPYPAGPSHSGASPTVPLGTAVPAPSAGPSESAVPGSSAGSSHSAGLSRSGVSSTVSLGSGASESGVWGAGVMVLRLCEGLELRSPIHARDHPASRSPHRAGHPIHPVTPFAAFPRHPGRSGGFGGGLSDVRFHLHAGRFRCGRRGALGLVRRLLYRLYGRRKFS